MNLSSSLWRNRTRTTRLLAFAAATSLLITGCAAGQSSTSRQAEGVPAALVGSEQPSASASAPLVGSDEDAGTDSDETTDENSEEPSTAPDDSPTASDAETATAIVDATEKDLGQTPAPFNEGEEASTSIASGAIDPAAANVWVEMDNLSSRTVEVTSYDQADRGNVQVIRDFTPGSPLDLWGAATNGTDVWVKVRWCENPKEKVVNDRCPGSRFREMALDINNSWLGAYLYLSFIDEKERDLIRPTINVGQSFTYGPFSKEQPIKFVVTRESDRNITHKILRYQFQIKDGQSS